MLRVNSPGGSAVASEIILDATKRVKAKKPFVVSMGDVAGSGGYYVACGSDTIFADESTITGSIGVVAGKLATTDMWKQGRHHLQALPARARTPACSPPPKSSPTSSAQRMQGWMDEIYGVFKGHVTAIRGDRLKKPIDELAGGRVYTGKQALELGLVDKIGTLEDAISHVAEEAKARRLRDQDRSRSQGLPRRSAGQPDRPVRRGRGTTATAVPAAVDGVPAGGRSGPPGRRPAPRAAPLPGGPATGHHPAGAAVAHDAPHGYPSVACRDSIRSDLSDPDARRVRVGHICIYRKAAAPRCCVRGIIFLAQAIDCLLRPGRPMQDLPAIELLESTHTFPCPYTFKVIGRAEGNFVGRVVQSVRRELPPDIEPPSRRVAPPAAAT